MNVNENRTIRRAISLLQANLVSPKQFVLENVDKPVPNQDEVLISVKWAGICGSDVHAYYGKHPFISCPIVPGHEFVGIVEQVGDGTKDLLGKRVTVLPSLVCGECYNCRTGRFNICDTLRVIGCQAPGAFAEYTIVPKDKVFVLPDAISWAQGVLVEPHAVAVHAVRMAGNIAGKNVVVMGAGTIGLMVISTLKAYGAGNIVVTDFNEERLALARDFGADTTLNPGTTSLREYVEQEQHKVDIIFECVGVQATVNEGIELVSKGGDVLIVGVFEEDVMVKMGLVQDKEIRVQGTLMYDKEDYYEALRLIAMLPEVTKIITNRFSLNDVAKAYEHIEQQPESVVKVLLEI